MAEDILYTIEIRGLDEQLQKMADLTKAIDDNKKALKDGTDATAKDAELRKVQLKQQQDAYRQLTKEVKVQAAAEKQGAQTLGQLRARLSEMNKELDNAKIGSKRFKELTVESKKLRESIKSADESTGRFNANVGNYKGAILDAFRQMGVNVSALTTAVTASSTAMKAATVSTGGMSGALKVFKIALASTGIGAIVVALGTLITYLTQTQAGMDTLNKVLKPLGTVFARITGLIEKFGGGLAEIFSGNFREGFRQIGDAVNSVGSELSDAWKDGQRLADILIEIDNANLKLAENEGRLRREMQEQLAILDDVNKTDAERKAAGEEYLKLQDELLSYKKTIADLELEQAELNAKQNDTDRATQIELAQLKEKSNELEAESLQRQREAKNKINAIDKRAADEQKKAIEEIAAMWQKVEDDRVKALDKYTESLKKQADDILSEYEQLSEDILNETIATDTAQADSNEKKLLAQYDADQAYRRSKLDTYTLQLEDLNNLHDKQLISDELYAKQKADIEKASEEASRKLHKETINQRLSAASNALGQLAEFAGKETAVGKGAAVAQAAINTYLGVSQSLSTYPMPIAAVFAALSLASGLATVQKIMSVDTNVNKKFAGGVIGLSGAGSETSDSIDAKLSRGESVMTAKATRVYAPVLADMERSVGNRPNVQIGNGRFASGIIQGNIGQPRTNYTTEIERAMQKALTSVTEIPVVVSETDITGTQNKVRKIKVTGDL